jgi:DNA-binding NtrC family response regulator
MSESTEVVKNTLIFVVEDDQWYREYVSYTMSLDPEHEVKQFETASQLIEQLNAYPDIITLDYSLPDMNGDELLDIIKKKSPGSEVIIISEQDKIDTAVNLLKAGAYDYFIKSKNIRDRLLNTVSHIKNSKNLLNRVTRLEKEVKDKYDFRSRIIGKSKPILHVFDLIGKAFSTNLTVMVTGETGTGKEDVAKAIHYNSRYSSGPFVPVNMAAIPGELAESELFGHEKGSFTGASATRIGKFEEANKGTIFLDEIGDVSLSLQVKLLRVLQERSVTRVGGTGLISIDTRVIVATHRDLLEEVKKGNFREDLYYRLFGLTIKMPPLRERGNDVLLLATYFITSFCKENGMKVKVLNAGAKDKLLAYHFPGNVRELKSLVELACVLCDSAEIGENDIQLIDIKGTSGFLSKERTMEDYNRKIIHYFLEKYDQNVILVAEKLDIGKSTIYRMLKREKETVE